MLNNNQKLLHPIVKHIRFVAQQAIEGSHAAQLQKNTQHFFFWWPYCLLDSSM